MLFTEVLPQIGCIEHVSRAFLIPLSAYEYTAGAISIRSFRLALFKKMENITVFNGFNSLRFIAAYLVLTTHLELIRAKFNLFNLRRFPFLNEGGFAVEFFFVLSGFLITYLLLKEEKKKSTISIRNFYVRRILRIWPLYYIIVVLGLIIIPFFVHALKINLAVKIPFYPSILLFIGMLPNLVNVIYGSSFLSPLWSIGVEEQFYLIWAPVFKYLKKYFIHFLLAVIIVRLVFIYLVAPHIYAMQTRNSLVLVEFLMSIKFECMAIGALGAVVLYRGKFVNIFRYIFSLPAQGLVYAYFLTIFLLHVKLGEDLGFIDSSFVHSIFVLLLLYNISLNPKSIVKLQNRMLNFLGEISYGIYMYHSIVIFAVFIVIKGLLQHLSPVAATIVAYASVSGLTFLVAYLSFRFIEKPIISLRSKFQ